jgi:hypothetical protein
MTAPIPSKCWAPSTILCSVASQKTVIIITMMMMIQYFYGAEMIHENHTKYVMITLCTTKTFGGMTHHGARTYFSEK